MDACDTMKEGFLNNPRECKVDFSKLACRPERISDSCLTAPQLRDGRDLLRRTKNSKGELIFSGQALGNPIPALRGATGAPGGGYDTVRIWGFQDANYDWHTFDLDRDMPIINKKVGFVDAVDSDLRSSRRTAGSSCSTRAGATRRITPENTVLYYESLVKNMGVPEATSCVSSWCRAWRTAAAATARTRSTRWRPWSSGGSKGSRRLR